MSTSTSCFGHRTKGAQAKVLWQRFLGQRRLVLALAVCGVVALLAFGCAPQQAQQNTGSSGGASSDNGSVEEGGQVNLPAWSPQSDCSACHTAEQSSLQKADTGAGAHSGASAVACVQCHTESSALATLHDNATAGQATAKKLKKTEVSSAACEASGCHSNASERIAATASLTTLTDRNGLTVNPHDLPANASHAKITCSSCHKGHEALEPLATCTSCHHQKVFECYTCHD